MLSNETRDFIRLNLKDLFNKNDLENGIVCLERYLEFINSKYRDSYEDILNEYSQSPILKQRNIIKSFIDIEHFLSLLADVLHLKEESKNVALPSDATHNNNINNWGMERLYKIAFELFPHDYKLSTESIPLNLKNKNNNGKDYHFLNLYYYRNNIGSHFNTSINTNTLTSIEINSYTQSMLFVLVFLMLKYQKDLEKIYETNSQRQFIKQFDVKAFTNEIISNYERTQKFEYLDTKWDFDLEKSNGLTIKGIINEDNSRRIVAFIGEAGTGKTTALKRLEFEYAKKCSKNSITGLPIYIELKNLPASDSAIFKAITDRLGISEENAKNVISNEAIILLLDGFNEISNEQFAASIKAEVENIIDSNDKILLFVTDRTNSYTLFKVMQTTYYCYLHELSMEEKVLFFEINSKKAGSLDIIKEQVNKELSGTGTPIIQTLKTPYMLSVFLSYVDDYGSVPEDTIKNYLEKLFEREEKEQKDSDDPKHFEELKIVLAALACKYDKKDFRSLDAQWVIGRIKELFAYKDLDSIECIDLSVKMGLLSRSTNNALQFKSKEISDYFYIYALNEGLDTYFNE